MAYVDKINKSDVDYDIQDSKAARSVDGTTASHVEEANQIYTATGVSQTEYFTYRTTAGDASISTGSATLAKVIGHTVQTGHTDEVFNMESSFSDSSTTVSVDMSIFRGKDLPDGDYLFTYDGSSWTLGSTNVDLTEYGLTVTGNVSENDIISITYVALVIGELATATPTAFVSTGYNQYNATAGYAHVIGNNQYRISGTYTSLGLATEIGGATTAVTVTGGKFTPATDGYIYVTGASGDILIALVWSGIRDSDPFEAYEADTIAIPTEDASSTALPTASYGMPSVHRVYDELSLADKQYVQRIGHYTYSSANLSTVEALGVDYWYDENDIFYVLAEPIVYTLASTVTASYVANDFGTEEFTGTETTVGASLYYGNNLVDKLRNLADIQTIGTGLTLTDGELAAGGGGGGDSVYSPKTTSNNSDGGAVYIGNKNANQEVQEDPTTTDQHYKYFWALPTGGSDANSLIPKNGTIDILGDVESGNDYGVAIGYLSQLGLYAGGSVALGFQAKAKDNASGGIAIGQNVTVSGEHGIGIGGSIAIGSSSPNCVAIGHAASCYSSNCVALGKGAYPTRQGEVNVGCDNTTAFNNTNFRVIGGVHDGQLAHDAVTVAQVNATIDAINTALSTNIPHIGAQS